MWKSAGVLVMCLCWGTVCLAQNGGGATEKTGLEQAAALTGTADKTPPGETPPEDAKVYRHMVLFKFKQDASPDQIQDVVAAFGQLQKHIETIIGYEHGTDVSPEKLSKGFTHCFLLTFRSKTDLEAYLPHPAHQAFTVKLKPILADVLVVDYWARP